MRRGLLTAVCCSFALLLVGCGFKDGTYTAEFQSFDSLGYKDRLQITVEDGVITDARIVAKGDYLVMVVANTEGADYAEIDTALDEALK